MSCKNGSGYVLLSKFEVDEKCPYKRKDGMCLEHIHVWWKNKPNELILYGEVIHHKNNVKDDNRIENLKKISTNSHSSLHWKDKKRLINWNDIEEVRKYRREYEKKHSIKINARKLKRYHKIKNKESKEKKKQYDEKYRKKPGIKERDKQLRRKRWLEFKK